jgi:hypothetical protein
MRVEENLVREIGIFVRAKVVVVDLLQRRVAGNGQPCSRLIRIVLPVVDRIALQPAIAAGRRVVSACGGSRRRRRDPDQGLPYIADRQTMDQYLTSRLETIHAPLTSSSLCQGS